MFFDHHRRSPAQLATEPGVVTVRSIETAPTQHSYTTFQAVALGMGAAGLLFPMLIFVGMATRVAAARREQRLAAMRLVGATVTPSRGPCGGRSRRSPH